MTGNAKPQRLRAGFALTLAVLACSDDNSSGPRDARPDSTSVDAAPPRTFKQIDMLGRPGIAEVLLLSNDRLAEYNANAPIFADVPEAAVRAVVSEAKAVLKAIYLGVCFINGRVVPAFDPATGARPAGLECHAVGDAIFTSGMLSPASVTKSEEYATRVVSQLLPDVLRVDLGVASTYLDVCSGAAPNVPLLCGGRLVHEDVIDVTYDYLINGAATTKDELIKSRLVSDGVQFSQVETENSLNRTSAPASGNPAQGHATAVAGAGDSHPNVSNTVFPYAAPAR